MEDLRRRKSKELLKNAFWIVLETKKYTQISIKDIVEEAGVNRKTFSSNYDSIDILMESCIEDLFQQLLLYFEYRHPDGSPDFSRSTYEYTRFALDNQHRLRLIFSNQLDGVALHIWKKIMIASSPSPAFLSSESALRYDLYLNYSIYCCWGNLLWVLDHADLPLDKLVKEALDVYHIFLKNQTLLYSTPETMDLFSLFVDP